jgi:hypothetical protein
MLLVIPEVRKKSLARISNERGFCPPSSSPKEKIDFKSLFIARVGSGGRAIGSISGYTLKGIG